jgi:trimethylguanosine synthase
LCRCLSVGVDVSMIFNFISAGSWNFDWCCGRAYLIRADVIRRLFSLPSYTTVFCVCALFAFLTKKHYNDVGIRWSNKREKLEQKVVNAVNKNNTAQEGATCVCVTMNQKATSQPDATKSSDNNMNNNEPGRRGESNSRSPSLEDSNNSHDTAGVGQQGRGVFGRGMQQRNKKPAPPADMTVIVNRSDLWDSAAHFQPPEDQNSNHHHPNNVAVAPYHFAYDQSMATEGRTVAVARVPHVIQFCPPKKSHDECRDGVHRCEVIDKSIPNPHDSSICHDKYWAQRRRLFSKFDRGIQLDAQSWFSVTPEIIADHVAHRVAELVTATDTFALPPGQGLIVMDSFCGVGGNAIGFSKMDSHLISKVVCVDTDRAKLLMAAQNASIYGIPKDKLVFVECNSIFILQHCYKNGEFVLDQPTAAMPPYLPSPVMPTEHAGYKVGGLDMLPRRIDCVFIDPPWGGVDYEVLGKNGYDLQKNMKIQVDTVVSEEEEEEGALSDDFFDTFSSPRHPTKMSQRDRKENFNKTTEGEFINGVDLLKLAAEATRSRVVVYDLPRNTNKTSLGKSALAAGYRGNMKLDEHYLNGRLKTVTGYFGGDYSSLLYDLEDDEQQHQQQSNTLT